MPGCGPRNPSLTAVVLALSDGGSVWCGTASDALPEPLEVLSARRLRAEEALTFNRSIVLSKRRDPAIAVASSGQV